MQAFFLLHRLMLCSASVYGFAASLFRSREKQLESNSTLAEFMLAPLTGMAFVLGREEEEEVDGTSLQDLEETFEQSLVEIFGALEFEHIVKREETSSSETTKVMDLCAPDALMRERASVRFRMSGCSNPVAWENSMKRFDQYESSAKNWSVLSETVDIMQLYKFCNYLDGYKSGEVVRAPTSKLSTKATTGCGCSGHVVFGFILGLLGFYLFSFLAPQGDSYAWVYYWVDRQEFVQVRCTETNSTSSSSPWCDATDYLLMSRTTLWVSHAAMWHPQDMLPPRSPFLLFLFPLALFHSPMCSRITSRFSSPEVERDAQPARSARGGGFQGHCPRHPGKPACCHCSQDGVGLTAGDASDANLGCYPCMVGEGRPHVYMSFTCMEACEGLAPPHRCEEHPGQI